MDKKKILKNIIDTKIVKEGIFTHNILENIYKLFPNLQGRIYFDNANRTLIPVTVFNKIAELLANLSNPYGLSKPSISITNIYL